MRQFLRNHGLSITMLGFFFLVFWFGQMVSGRFDYNDERAKSGEPPVGWADYLTSAHFGEATAENWESEFLQMFIFIVATALLYQKGSAESRDPRKSGRALHTRAISADSPWPLRRGGWVRRLYEHSLSLAFLALFLFAFAWHARSGWHLYNEERVADSEAPVSFARFLISSRFWFESLQNWQSEFLAISCMVLFTIFLRERDSPESKDPATPTWENEP